MDRTAFRAGDILPVRTPMSSTSPDYYKFGNVELNTITGQLTGNISQAVQYLVRSSRLDGVNKNDTIEGRIEDLEKAIVFARFEIDRLEAELESGKNGVPAPKTTSTIGDGRILGDGLRFEFPEGVAGEGVGATPEAAWPDLDAVPDHVGQVRDRLGHVFDRDGDLWVGPHDVTTVGAVWPTKSAGEKVVYQTWDDVPDEVAVKTEFFPKPGIRIKRSRYGNTFFRYQGDAVWYEWDWTIDSPDDFAPFVEV